MATGGSCLGPQERLFSRCLDDDVHGLLLLRVALCTAAMVCSAVVVGARATSLCLLLGPLLAWAAGGFLFRFTEEVVLLFLGVLDARVCCW